MVLSNQPGKSDQLPVMRLESSSSRENLLLDFIPLLIGRDLLQPEAQNSLVAGLCHLLDAPVAGICLFQGRAATGTFQIEAEIQSINLADPTPGWDELLQSGAIFGPNAWISGRGSEIAGLDDIQAGLTEEITAWMGAPLRFGGVNTGALLVGRQAGPPFVESDLKLLADLSEVVPVSCTTRQSFKDCKLPTLEWRPAGSSFSTHATCCVRCSTASRMGYISSTEITI